MIPADVTEQSLVLGGGSRGGDMTAFASLSLCSQTDSWTAKASYTSGLSGKSVGLSTAYSGSGDNSSMLKAAHALTGASIMQLTARQGRMYMDATMEEGMTNAMFGTLLKTYYSAKILLDAIDRSASEYLKKRADEESDAKAADEKSTSSAATGGPKGQLPDGEDPEEEAKYADNPKNPGEASFKPIGSKGARENLEDGSIWEKDTSSHGGEQWKRWPNKRSWEKGEKPNSIWPDGRVRK